MARVSTNKVALAYAKEETIGVLPTTPQWKTLEPNDITTFGSTITTVAREPISKDRQRKKGTTTDLESAVEFEADLTMEHVLDFLSNFVMADYAGTAPWGEYQSEQFTDVINATSDYTVTADGALSAGQLIYVRGCTNSDNNGLKTVVAGSTATSIRVAETLVDEDPVPTEARIAVCGYEGDAADLEIDASGDLISNGGVDFTTLGLTVGQVIWIGGTAALNRFAEDISNDTNRGWARITAITAAKLTLDKKSTVFAVDDGSGKEIHIYFGRFLRNVSVDDALYLEESLQFEAAYEDLGGVGTPEYEYAKGNYCNQVQVQLPLTDKATATFGFHGTDTAPPSGSRATGADTPLAPVQTVAFNTSADIARLRIIELDETGISTCFKSLNLTLNNNISPIKCLGTLGATALNVGQFFVDVEAQLLFTNSAVPTAIRDNTTVALDFALRNDDGAFFVDVPSMTMGGGDKEFPANESVLINTTSMAFEDATLGYCISVSLFPYAPAA
jgi:hypothetical protein